MLKQSKKYLQKELENLKKNDVVELQNLIKYHSDLYYNKNEPIISDFEYDNLLKKLETLEKRFNISQKQSQKVWSDIKQSTFKKVKHTKPMISLDNTYNETELRDFDKRVSKLVSNMEAKKSSILDETEKIKLIKKIKNQTNLEELHKNLKKYSDLNKLDKIHQGDNKKYQEKNIKYTIEYKFDWVWIELIYDKWKLIQAITRWNWIEWEDVTENIMQIINIPKKIEYKNYLEIRWEIIMPISIFEILNKQAKTLGTKIFSNPRNAASWSIRLLDTQITKSRKLKFFAYDLANYDNFLISPSLTLPQMEREISYFQVIKFLEKLWFEISNFFEICKNIEILINKIINFDKITKKQDFEIDGLVIKVNNIDLWDKIGKTEHHPRYAIAYKFPAEIVTTKILNVEHQIWRTGTITPVANLEEVNISWAMIKRATLHNYEEVANLDIRLWDSVFIKRAWEVIPKIISVVKEWRIKGVKKILPPNVCPSCGAKISKDDEKVRYYCSNHSNCLVQIEEQLIFAVWKNWFDIDWLWEKQIKLFLKKWIIKDLSDIFNIKNKQKDILDFEWFQEKSVTKLVDNIELAKKVKIDRLLASLGIPWVWKKTAKILSKLFISDDILLNFKISFEELEKLEDIWPEIAKNVLLFFDNQKNIEFLKKLTKVLKIKFESNQNIDIKELQKEKFFNKKVCITGSFENYKRDDLVEILEKKWWRFVSSITKKTDFLLAWEKAWTKLEKAQSLWVKILNLNEFL